MDITTIFSTISIVIAIITVIIAIVGWLNNRDSKTDKDAEWKGQVNAKLDIIISLQSDIKEAKTTLQDHETRICLLEKVNEKRS